MEKHTRLREGRLVTRSFKGLVWNNYNQWQGCFGKASHVILARPLMV